jgi:hypothetical protein
MGSPPMEEALGLEEMKEAAHKRGMKSISTLVTSIPPVNLNGIICGGLKIPAQF